MQCKPVRPTASKEERWCVKKMLERDRPAERVNGGYIGLYSETCRIWPLPSAPAQSSGGCDRCNRYTCCSCTCSVTWRGCRNTQTGRVSIMWQFQESWIPKLLLCLGLEMEECREVSTVTEIHAGEKEKLFYCCEKRFLGKPAIYRHVMKKRKNMKRKVHWEALKHHK